MNPDNPVKALYVEFLKGYDWMDLSFDQVLLMLANMVLQKRFHSHHHWAFSPEKGKYKEMTVSINELMATLAERCAELQKRSKSVF